MTNGIPEHYAHLPLQRGNEWVRVSDGEIVEIRNVIGRDVRYRFSDSGSHVTRIARFIRLYHPRGMSSTPTSSPGLSDPPETGSGSVTPDSAPGTT